MVAGMRALPRRRKQRDIGDSNEHELTSSPLSLHLRLYFPEPHDALFPEAEAPAKTPRAAANAPTCLTRFTSRSCFCALYPSCVISGSFNSLTLSLFSFHGI
jgi:hypothetical protein